MDALVINQLKGGKTKNFIESAYLPSQCYGKEAKRCSKKEEGRRRE